MLKPLAVTLTAVAVMMLAAPALAESPVKEHGLLRVKETKIVDQSGKPVSLAGNSF